MISTNGAWVEAMWWGAGSPGGTGSRGVIGHRRTSAALTALLVLALTACSSGGGPVDADDALLIVTRDGEVLASWSAARIEGELEMVELRADGDDLRGPSLRSLLAASGVEQWSRLTVTGKGQGRAFDVTLDVESADVDETWVLSFTRRGDLRLAGPSLPREQWVRGVEEIEVVE